MLCHNIAQQDSTTLYEDEFGGLFQLDEVVVSASRSGFKLDDFIKMVQEDTSFYQSFRNIRFLQYTGRHDLRLFDKKGAQRSFYRSVLRQSVNGLCRYVNFIEEEHDKKYYKRNNKHRFYTGKLLDALFQQSACETTRKANLTENASGKIGKHIVELKKLIFSPGQKADVPLIGNKTAIFDSDMKKYYDFSITSRKYNDQVDCYVFTAALKPIYTTKKKDKTVVKFLETFFDKTTFNIVSRNYHLAYYGALFDFDVKMNIECAALGDSYIPVFINYDGFWDIPGRKPEIGKFTIRIEDVVEP